MTQILLYRGDRGIALATDSKAISFVPGERTTSITVQKIFVLSPSAVLATGGAGYGVLLCHRFQDYVKSRGLSDFNEIREQVIPYLQEQTDDVHARNLYRSGRSDLERVYFLLAGVVPAGGQNPSRFELFGSEHFGDPLHIIKTGRAVAIPRQMGVEFRLNRLGDSPGKLEEAESICENFLMKLSCESDEVGPPFYFVQVTAEGIKIRTKDTLD